MIIDSCAVHLEVQDVPKSLRRYKIKSYGWAQRVGGTRKESYGWALQNEGTRNTLGWLSGQRRSTIYGWALQAAV